MFLATDIVVPPDEPQGIYLEAPLTDGALRSNEASPLPTMQQSLWLSTDFFEGAHFALGKIFDPYDRSWWKRFLGRMLAGTADVLLLAQLPLGSAWHHEEWHRAVLKNRGIDSYNGVYDLELFRDLIKVSQVSDDGLTELKAEHSAEMVRMSSAGIESGYELATNLEKVNVFYTPRTWPSVAVGMLNLSNIFYMMSCANPDSDARVTAEEAKESSVRDRDFTGLDCTGWTYDLFRPNEPYAARGPHPAGDGIRRYRRWTDLTPDEQGYLETQRNLSFLNLIDPVMFGFPSFSILGARTTGHVRHMPTSFGSALNLEIFVHTMLAPKRPLNVFAALHSYWNREHVFPGLTLEVHRFALPDLMERPSWIGARVGLWLQPRDQSFTTATIAPGALVAARFGYEVTSALSPFVEVEGKSAGFVAGNVALGPSIALRAGLTLWAR